MKTAVLNLIAEITDYPVSDLYPEMLMEAELGIDSIKFFELAARLPECMPEALQKSFKADFQPQELMSLASVEELIDFLNEWVARNGESPVATSETIHAEILHAQSIFLVAHWCVSTCSLCSRLRIEGPLNIEGLNRAWHQLIQRHPSLRSRFTGPETGKLSEYQLEILPETSAPPKISVTDLRDRSKPEQKETVLAAMAANVEHNWDIGQWPLHRFELFRLSDQAFDLFFVTHHLVSDGLSNQIALEEFVKLYDAELSGSTPRLPPATTVEAYTRAVSGMNDWKNRAESKAMKWFLVNQGRNTFVWNPRGSKPTLDKPPVINRLFKLDKAETARLKDLMVNARVSLNSIMAAAYLKTIQIMDDSVQSIILNVPTSGRLYPGIEAFNMIGCFAQNLALTFDLEDKDDWLTLIRYVETTIHGAVSDGLDRAQTHEAGASLGRLPLHEGRLDESVASMIRAGVKSNVYLSFIGKTHFEPDYRSLALNGYHPATTTASSTLDTLVEIADDALHLAVNADRDFFGEEFVMQFGNVLLQALAQAGLITVDAGEHPQQHVAGISDPLPQSLLTIAENVMNSSFPAAAVDQDLEAELGMDSLERIRIITALRQAHPAADRHALMASRTLREMATHLPPQEDAQDTSSTAPPFAIISEQSLRTPQGIAILDGNRTVSYEELHSHSNRLANYLLEKGTEKGALVAIMAPRSAEMIIGALSILKAGCAYVPIDPTYPPARIDYIVRHSEAEIILFDGDSTAPLQECISNDSTLREMVLLSDSKVTAVPETIQIIGRECWQSCSDRVPNVRCSTEDLMTVLYTSGSTGTPKGVALNHAGYTNRLNWMQKSFPIGPGDRIAHKTSCCFDISVWELFWPLMTSATICPVSPEIVKNPWDLAEWLIKKRINVMHFVPSLFGEFLNSMEGEQYRFPDLRWLIFSGEVLPVSFIRRWIDRFGMNTRLANLYGPTEASIDVTAHIITERPDESMLRIPIGEPVDNTSILILDKEMRRLPPGEKGELWIGGMQLATGYLHDPERTGETFIPNPFSDIDSDRLYRSGDLAMELEDGSFDYLGRIDSQIKIRGFRVELGEIEAVIDSHPKVKSCAVIVQDTPDGNKRLAACISGAIDNIALLREHAAQKL
ncbi:amino acid adenylation domain-containing protein, partial [Pseudomonadota bacterium]